MVFSSSLFSKKLALILVFNFAVKVIASSIPSHGVTANSNDNFALTDNFFDSKGRFSKAVEVVCAEAFGVRVSAEDQLAQLNLALQKGNFLRKPGSLRCQVQANPDDSTLGSNPVLCEALKRLNLTGNILPRAKKYDCVVIHPGEYHDWVARINFVLDLATRGLLQFDRLVLLVGSRIIQREEFLNAAECFEFLCIERKLPIKKELALDFLQGMCLPEGPAALNIFLQCINRYKDKLNLEFSEKSCIARCKVLSTNLQFDIFLSIDQSPNSNTQTTIAHLLKEEAERIRRGERYLFVSNNPYVLRQHLTVQQVLNQNQKVNSSGVANFIFETAGPGVSTQDLIYDKKFTAIFRDEFARLIYTMWQLKLPAKSIK